MVGAKKTAVLILVLLLIAGAGCSPKKKFEGKLGYDELYNALERENNKLKDIRKKELKLESNASRALPSLEPIAPTYDPLAETPISITVNDEPIHNVLYIVARNAGLNLVIEPNISLDNRITVSFERAPSSVVVQKLLSAYDLAYSVEDNVLFVKRFVEKTFVLNFLNTKSEVTMDAGGDAQGGTGSSFKSNFQVDTLAGEGIEDGTSYKFIANSMEEFLDYDNEDRQKNGYYNLDPIAGVLTVQTTPSTMRKVSEFVDRLSRAMGRQIVIDARILEVNLSDGFQFGVDWNFVGRLLDDFTSLDISYTTATGALPVLISRVLPTVGDDSSRDTTMDVTVDGFNPNANTITMTESATGTRSFSRASLADNGVIAPTITALENFGDVKTISNPHIRAKHRQAALFMSGVTRTYIRRIEITYQEVGGTTVPIRTPVEADAFTGVMLGVVPFINDDNTVDLQIFPIKSEVQQLVPKIFDQNEIELPVTATNVVNTSVKARDGDVIILGGIINNRLDQSDSGLPWISRIPGLGALFKTDIRDERVSELVIVMHIRVVDA